MSPVFSDMLGFALAALVVAVSILPAVHAEHVPEFIKNRIESWVLNDADDQFAEALVELNERGIINARIPDVHSLPAYGQTNFVKITGNTGQYKQSSPVSLIVIDPDGGRSTYTIPVLMSGTYSTVVPITHDSPKGTYLVIAYHDGKKLPDSLFFVEYSDVQVPRWILSAAVWWLEGQIADADFFAGLQFLIDNEIIMLGSAPEEPQLHLTVDGHKAVRRGTTQDISVYVTGAHGPVEGATVFVRVEDYGEDVFEEFEGLTDSSGQYSISWEIGNNVPNLKTFVVYVDATDGISSSSKTFTFEAYCLCGEADCKCRT